ncbi:MAG: hypothetical protein RR705_04235 [Lachnospiraceae bacterium]
MKEHLFFSINPTDDTIEDIKTLQCLMMKLGINVYCKTMIPPSLGEEIPNESSLIIEYDLDMVKEKTTRHAGRKYKLFKHYQVLDVRNMIDAEGAQAAALQLGMSKATMYRKLKEATKWNEDYI